MNNDSGEHDSRGVNHRSSAEPLAQQPTVAAIEFMTFHHEVLAAFCKHTIELRINTLLISPSTGIQKAISRFAADSVEALKELAIKNQTGLSLRISHSRQEIASHLMEADALFIGTVPPFRSPKSKQKANQSHFCSSRHEEMIAVVRTALQQNKLIYIVIHKPLEDAAQLIASLDADECAKISVIYLSRETAEFCRQCYPNYFRSELIMPAIGPHDAFLTENRINNIRATTMVVAGEISAKRRHYEDLSALQIHQKWLSSQQVRIQIIGRIKLESCREKVGRFCGLPAKWLFFVKYPSLLPLWLNRCLDLSMTRYSKVSDQALADALANSACLLDLKRAHYSEDGQTSGALGLAMTHQKPLINLAKLLELISISKSRYQQQGLRQILEREAIDLIAEKEHLVAQFQQQLRKELLEASI